MLIQIDSREHKFELARIQRQLTRLGVKTIVSKLYVGDYQNFDNPRVVIDRKKDLQELCGNVAQQHDRFRRELLRAQEAGIRVIILCEHGGEIRSLDDVMAWQNPRLKKSPKALTGEKLFKILTTLRRRYGVSFEFCDKTETGRKIVRLLSYKE